MSLLRFLGLGSDSDVDANASSRGETASVRRIARQLEGLDPDTARFLAAFAFVLGRVAHADLSIDAEEMDEMKRRLCKLVCLDERTAEIAVDIARSEVKEFGGVDNYVVTREFRRISSREQRVQLLDCLYAVAAADGTISSAESTEVYCIADELGFTRAEANAIRSSWKDKLAVFQMG